MENSHTRDQGKFRRGIQWRIGVGVGKGENKTAENAGL